jgi:hypothetical protein
MRATSSAVVPVPKSSKAIGIPISTTASKSSFWDIANLHVDTKTRKSLANVNIGNGQVIDAVLKEATSKQRALNAKRWKVGIRGKEVIVSEVFAKIIRWIDHFKTVGAIAVQFNSGAASLPWAAVRFLLQVAVDDQQYLEVTIEGIEIIVHTIAVYAAVQDLYLAPDFPLHTEIRTKIIRMYVHILCFLGESIQYFQRGLASEIPLFHIDIES